MPSPIPTPLPIWAKVALQLAPFAAGYLYNLLDHAEDVPETDEWRHVSLHLQNQAVGAVAADDAYIGFDLVNITSGAVDNSWTTGDYTTCETALNTLWTNLSAYVPSYYHPTEWRWYRRQFNPYTESKPFVKSGPPVRVTSRSGAGAAPNTSPPQMSLSVTERTPWPKHWGRFYLPIGGDTNYDTGGRVKTSVVDAVATACQSAYATLGTAEFFPVVPVTQVDKVPARGLVGVTSIQVDNVPDVIRRRRWRNTTYRKILP